MSTECLDRTYPDILLDVLHIGDSLLLGIEVKDCDLSGSIRLTEHEHLSSVSELRLLNGTSAIHIVNPELAERLLHLLDC